MYRTYIYLPEELKYEIEATAQSQKKSKAEVIRKALESGLKKTKTNPPNSAAALVKMAKMAEKLGGGGPKDLSINHDYYTWGGEKRFKG